MGPLSEILPEPFSKALRQSDRASSIHRVICEESALTTPIPKSHKF